MAPQGKYTVVTLLSLFFTSTFLKSHLTFFLLFSGQHRKTLRFQMAWLDSVCICSKTLNHSTPAEGVFISFLDADALFSFLQSSEEEVNRYHVCSRNLDVKYRLPPVGVFCCHVDPFKTMSNVCVVYVARFLCCRQWRLA